jgi:NAD-dependent dihydropyrimidine dehydrogenase PreA subunit
MEMFVVTINDEACAGCGECVEACPGQIFKLENGKAVASSDECLGCQGCVAVCTVGAIKVEEF